LHPALAMAASQMNAVRYESTGRRVRTVATMVRRIARPDATTFPEHSRIADQLETHLRVACADPVLCGEQSVSGSRPPNVG
jgi:hypothetical protein